MEVNYGGSVEMSVILLDRIILIEPVVYTPGQNERIVNVSLFALAGDKKPDPALHSSHYVIPGVSAGNSISPIIHSFLKMNTTLSMGFALNGTPGIAQGWGLPSYYFAGFTVHHIMNEQKQLSKVPAGGYCIGLTGLPAADFWLNIADQNISPSFEYRSDLWNQLKGKDKLILGSETMISTGNNYYEAIRNYYSDLVKLGKITVSDENISTRKKEVMLSPMFCTWGEQKARGIFEHGTTQPVLDSIYSEFRSSGLKAKTFVVDDKWEDWYGGLEHSREKLPDFEKFLDKVRDDGMYVGLWTAFLRCECPEKYGLTTRNMLHMPDGKPFICTGSGKYYIYDVSQPEVQNVLERQAESFARRYHPDLVKIDYGYEVPPLNIAAPADMSYAGEKFFAKALEIFAGSVRKINSDVVFMYYNLSPLLTEFIDITSIDDLFLCQGDEAYSAGERILFSSLLGETGCPTYGSSGYEWNSASDIWFDSALSGTVGLIQSLKSDELGDAVSPSLIAMFNGIAQIRRGENRFRIEPLDCDFTSTYKGTHTASWARFENGQLVMLALRPKVKSSSSLSADYKNIIKASAPVIIATATSDDLVRSERLSVVPFGNGTLEYKTSGSFHNASLTMHLLKGAVKTKKIRFNDGDLKVPLSLQADNGDFIEWIDINLIR
jgi:hypothetical protein